jgi:hypothetical protein
VLCMSSPTPTPSGSAAGTSPAGRAAALNQFLSRAQHALLAARFTGTTASLLDEPRANV